MKFGKALETNAESMPEDWRPYVIHYKALKKRISTIVKELDDRGLPSPTIKNLLSQSMNGDAHRLEYTFDEDKQHLKACIKVVFDNLEPNLTDSGESSPVPLSPDEQLSRILAHELNLQNNSVYSLSSTSDSDDRISKKTNSLVDLLDDDPTAFYSSESDPSSPRLPTTRIVDNNGDEVNNENEVDNENEVNNEVSNENDHQINNQTLNSILHGPKTEEITQTLGAKSISQPLISSQPSEVTPTLDPSSTSEESENMETLVTPGAMHQQQSVMGISTESTLFNQSHSKVQTSFEDGKRVLVIELPADTAFFDQLGDEISNLSKLQQANKHGFESKVEDLSKILTHVSSPHNKDMYTWREILRIYLEAQVFVGDQEADRSTRSSEKAEKQLQWFMTEMDRSKLTQKFKLSKSKVAFTTFFQLNSELIRMKQFRELNHMAMTKILKKHDKRTNLR
ncbi:hypothetical protein BGZ46_002273 [Entomortierella lignicola]|nr:hypothetical protein BGZ46_002273 [Entomortierella lignicola]